MTGVISQETKLRDEIVAAGRSLFDRRLTHAATGNISVRLDDGTMLMTPTDASLGDLDPSTLSLLDADGRHLSGAAPTKEAFLHTCIYCRRDQEHAIVHLHATHSVAVSVLADRPCEDVLPPLTAYYVMRVGRLPLIPYFPPGDPALAKAVMEAAGEHKAVLLANHGPVVAGRTVRDAQYAAEELEETARLYLMLEGRDIRPLTPDQVTHLLKARSPFPPPKLTDR